MAKLFLIDAHALCYRSFYAIKDLSTSKGQAVNAVFGFVNTLRKILRDYRPEYLAVCFDSPVKTRRQEKFNAYKIQRPVMPKDLIDQLPVIKDIVRAYHLAAFEYGGFEADDLIATITHKAAEEGMDVVIAAEDKDMYQLAGPNVSFLSARQDTLLRYEDLKDRLGFEPRHITDFIGLAGDKSDNIPGIKGIGDVTARHLIETYGALENILAHLEQLKSEKVREKLRDHKEEAVFSKELAVLETGVPIDFRLEDLEVKQPDQTRLLELFERLEFNKFARELKEVLQARQPAQAVNSRRVETREEADLFLRRVEEKKEFVFLLDGTQTDHLLAVRGMAAAVDSKEIFYIPSERFNLLEGILQDKEILKVTYDLKETVKNLSTYACVPEGQVFDVMLAGYLLGTAQSSLSLGQLAWTYLKESAANPEEIAAQTALLCRLYPLLSQELKEKHLEKLLEDIEIPLSYVLAQMETRGVRLDLELLQNLSKECERKLQELTTRLYAAAQEEFNLNSPKQLSRILFEKLKLPVVKKTKTGFSTDEEVLVTLSQTHDFPALILEYRQLAKLKSTYIDALPKLVNPKTGRVHARFHQTGAETGRLSSSQPNLQNIPIRTELGRQIRQAIVPLEKGHLLIAADYSQIELRILAHLSKDENLRKAFEKGEDIHAFTASLIFDVAEENVTGRMRDTAKRVNFGIIYGMSAFGLAKDLHIPDDEAQEFIDRYFLRYPRVKTFMEETVRRCEEDGFVTTLLNRRRYIPEITSKNNSLRMFAQRQAVNTPVQGSAADLMKLAMITIHQEMKKRGLASGILITVHDELVFDVPRTEEKELIPLIRQRMEHCLELSVPVKVNVKAGMNWLEMKEI